MAAVIAPAAMGVRRATLTTTRTVFGVVSPTTSIPIVVSAPIGRSIRISVAGPATVPAVASISVVVSATYRPVSAAVFGVSVSVPPVTIAALL